MTHDESYLLTWFRAFYSELSRVKGAIRSEMPLQVPMALQAPGQMPVEAFLVGNGAEVEAEEAASDAPEGEITFSPASLQAAVLAVRQRLTMVLERQEKAARQIGGDFAFAQYHEAQYVMAALADEILLHTPWPARERWSDYLLETKLFETQVAGERFFSRLNRILAEGDANQVELAKVYYLALVLGFEGGHRGKDPAVLTRYRTRLYDFIIRHDPGLQPEAERPFREAYQYTLDDHDAVMVPNPRRWAWVLVFTILALLITSFAVWRSVTHDLRDVLCDTPDVYQGQEWVDEGCDRR